MDCKHKKRYSSLEHQTCLINGHEIAVKIYREQRSNVRAAIVKGHAILRLPLFLLQKQETQHFEWFKNWLTSKLSSNDQLLTNLVGKTYRDGDTLHVGARTYTLRMVFEERATHTAALKKTNNEIKLCLSISETGTTLQKNIRLLLSRVVAKDFLPAVTERVHALNRLHFQKNITGVFLKYNTSNWGSCSTKGNINLSTRLLFAPSQVVDYVIIHELAHLVEMNHSSRFWALVAAAMPDYEAHERWLKTHDAFCNF